MKKIVTNIILVLLMSGITGAALAQSSYQIKVFLNDQSLEVFRDGELVKEMHCSTGIKLGSTPSGSFKTYAHKEKDVWVEDSGAAIDYYYITKFNNGVSFHSMIEGDHPLVEDGKKLYEANKPSSMGCVRLTKLDAKWIYDLPLGIPVEVIDGSKTSERRSSFQDEQL